MTSTLIAQWENRFTRQTQFCRTESQAPNDTLRFQIHAFARRTCVTAAQASGDGFTANDFIYRVSKVNYTTDPSGQTRRTIYIKLRLRANLALVKPQQTRHLDITVLPNREIQRAIHSFTQQTLRALARACGRNFTALHFRWKIDRIIYTTRLGRLQRMVVIVFWVGPSRR